MAGFPKKERQAIIDGYLNETGRNMFVPSEFIDWLAEKPDHAAFPIFFGMDDTDAARSYRIDLARGWAAGLRIAVSVNVVAVPSAVSIAKPVVREFPALVSPVAGRKDGGGYLPFDPNNAASMDELKRQAASALRAWLARYRGAAEAAGVDLAPIEEIASHLDGRVVGAA